jgi:hypothetical protein
VVVGFDVEAAEPDGEQAGSGWVGPEISVDIGRVDDAGQTGRPASWPSWYSSRTSKVHLPSRWS